MFSGARLRRRQVLVSAWAAIPLGLALFSVPARGQTIEWIRQFGTNAEDQAAAVAVDSTGVYVVGFTWGSLPGHTITGLQDAYVRKYDRSGNEVWTRQFATSGAERALGVAADSTGVYVVGYTTGTFPGQTRGGGALDAFVRKYDANGTEQWTRQFSSDVGHEEALGVALDATGVYVAGYTIGALPGQTLGSTGINDAFVRKYDRNGNEVWTRQFGTASGETIYGVAADSTGVYVAGATNGLLAGTARFGAFDAFLRKYDTNGTEQWTRQFGTVSGDYAWAVAASGSGPYVVGRTDNALPGQTSASPGVKDAFVRKYDTNGSEQWTRQFGTQGQDEAFGVAADATGVSVVGFVTFPLPGVPTGTIGNAFARKYDTNGTEQSTLQFGAGGTDFALGVAVDTAGTYVAGHTNGRIPGQTFLGSSDAFALKIAAPAGQISLRPQSFRFAGFAGGGVQRQALQIGTSSGALNWRVTATILNGTGWLTVNPPSGTATANLPSGATLQVNFGAFASPGTYQAEIVIEQSSGGVLARVPVTVVVSPAGSRLRLSQASFLFRTVVGGTTAAQSLRIVNGGQGSMSWTIPAPGTLSAPWLGISNLSGTANAGTRGSETTFSINTAGLVAGVYQALVPVSASGAANNPQLATVTLHVAPPATPASPELSAHGILFVVEEGAITIPLFDLLAGNAGGGTATFQFQTTTESGGNWLSVFPASGNVSTQTASVSVGLDLGSLPLGVYRGRITGTFTPGGTQVVEVTLIYAGDPIVLARDGPRAAQCAANSMEMVVTSIGTGSVVPLSFSRPLVATVVDSCGAPLDDAVVTASVENRNITLDPLGEGFYSATWSPERQTGSVPITFVAQHPVYPTVQRTVTVSAAAAAGEVSLPLLFPSGVVEGAGFTQRRPLAPGGIVSVFGERFAAANAEATSLPLQRSLGGVTVRIGGEDAPLYFAGSGQINAQVPYSVQPGSEVPVVVSVNGLLTEVQTYQIAPAQPGIFLAGGGGAILDGQSRLVNAANPAQRGDVLQIFATGLGQTDPPAQTGEGAPSFSRALLPVTVTVGGVEAPVQYQGLAPGFVGLYQVNVQLPTTVTPGDNVEVTIRQNGIPSNPGSPAKIPVR